MNASGRKVVDTNVVIRLLIGDDKAQERVAEALLQDHLFVPLTVLLETVWVLTSRYRLNRAEVAGLLERLVEFPAIMVEEPDKVGWAVKRFRRGADFGDMIHLIGGRHGQAFVTFDRDVAKQAGPDSPLTILTPES